MLADQTRAGLDILTNGDYHLDEDFAGRSWHHYPLQRWTGFEGDFLQSEDTRSPWLKYPPGTLLNEIYTGWRWPHVTAKIEHRPLDYAKIWRIAQARTTKPVRFGTCCSQVMGLFLDIHTKAYKDSREVVWDMSLTRNVRDVPTAIILQFIGTFGVWILADRIGLSGVLTMVCYAVFVARSAPERTPARIRLPSYAVWETVVFVLNVLAFVFIGLQIRPILTGLDPAARARYLYVAGAVLVTVIVVRVAWVMTQNAMFRWKIRKYGFHPPRPTLRPSVRSGLIISWSGMRGIVSLAAALALPTAATGAAFPFRDLIVITAFSVVLGTLVIQGLTLRPLIEALDLHDDDPVGREVDAGRNRALRAALATCADDMSPAAEAVRQEFAAHLKPATSVEAEGSSRESDHEAVHQRAIAAARQVILEMRSTDDIGDDAFHQLELELDWLEMGSGGRGSQDVRSDS